MYINCLAINVPIAFVFGNYCTLLSPSNLVLPFPLYFFWIRLSSVPRDVTLPNPPFPQMVAYGIVFIASLIGNISVVVISAANSHMRSAINAYLVNLAVADICIVLFCMWVHLVNNVTQPMFVLGAFWCKVNGFAQRECRASMVGILVLDGE